MVATAVLDELQLPPVTSDVKLVVVLLIQMLCVPDKFPAEGAAVIVTVLVAVALLQPPVPVTV